MTEAKLSDHVVSIDIAVPVRRVWDEITKTGRVQRALYNTILEADLRPGGRLRYYSRNKKRVFIVGEVVEVTPPTRFAHTYVFLQHSSEPTLVTWDLVETADGCRVTVTHSGWTADQVKHHKGAATGWAEILDLLKYDLETGDIPLKWKPMYAMMNGMLFMMPSRTKVEEVDRAGY